MQRYIALFPQKLHKSPAMYVFNKEKYNPGIRNPNKNGGMEQKK